MITKRRLPEMEGYGSDLLGAGPREVAPKPGAPPLSGNMSPAPMPPMDLMGNPQDPMAAVNPLNQQAYLPQRRRLPGVLQ